MTRAPRQLERPRAAAPPVEMAGDGVRMSAQSCSSRLLQPPLGLYLHVPWCVRKCPYCDFNSHALRGEVPADEYLAALAADVAVESDWLAMRGMSLPAVSSVFIGGGTPSLLPAATIAAALALVERAFGFAANAEITLEANPGAADAERFSGYREAGVNRLSVGVQSFNDAHLQAIGRVHDGAAARAALQAAHTAGFERVNADLMYALPGQDAAMALADVRRALEQGVTHLSHYQLTIEPNTAFWRSPPAVPVDAVVAEIEHGRDEILDAAGFDRYEVSAFAPPGERARHNLNYWRFGDYLGLGPGAHGKLTDVAAARQWRSARLRHPRAWMEGAANSRVEQLRDAVDPDRLAFEFMLNATRLREGFDSALFEARTGLPISVVRAPLQRAIALGLMERQNDASHWRPTARGFEMLNDVQALFL